MQKDRGLEWHRPHHKPRSVTQQYYCADSASCDGRGVRRRECTDAGKWYGLIGPNTNGVDGMRGSGEGMRGGSTIGRSLRPSRRPARVPDGEGLSLRSIGCVETGTVDEESLIVVARVLMGCKDGGRKKDAVSFVPSRARTSQLPRLSPRATRSRHTPGALPAQVYEPPRRRQVIVAPLGV